MFPTTYATSASLNEPSQVEDRHTMSARSPSVGISSKAIGLPGKTFALWELAPQAIWAQSLTALLLKLQTNPLDQISTPFLWNIWSVASSICS